jgi:hypothetical protein
MRAAYVWAAIAAATMLAACGKPEAPAAPAGDVATETPASPPKSKFTAATLLDPSAGGVTGGAIVELAQGGEFRVTDQNTTDHATKVWSLSEVAPNSDYLFQIQVKKNHEAAFGSLLQVDMQSGASKVSYECAFNAKDGFVLGRNAAQAPLTTAADDRDHWVVDCPTKAGATVDAVYVYVAPSIGGDPGSYDGKFTGSLDVKAIGYTLKGAMPESVPATPAPAAPSGGKSPT